MEKRFVIGGDIGGTNMRLSLVGTDGRVVSLVKVPTLARNTAADISERMAAACRDLAAEASSLGGRVIAVGLGVAGKINHLAGRVIFSPNLPTLNDYPLAAHLTSALGVPVVMKNDADMFGAGEAWAGTMRGVTNWVGMTLGTGVGGCLILNGRLWHGDGLGFSAEIGHMIIEPGGPLCNCGAHGCLEAIASGTALLRGVERAAADGVLTSGPLFSALQNGVLTPETVHTFAGAGDPLALRLFDRMGWALGMAIANLFTVLGIRHATLGGGVSASWDLFITPLLSSLTAHCSMLSSDEMVVRRSQLGDDGPLLGAARTALEFREEE